MNDSYKQLKTAKQSYFNQYGNYEIFLNLVLDYRVPIAAQTCIVLTRDMDNNLIQDLYSQPYHSFDQLFISIFPLKKISIVLVFAPIGSRSYKKYKKQLCCRSLDEQLREVWYLLLRYRNDHYFFHPLLLQDIEDQTHQIQEVLGISEVTVKLGNRRTGENYVLNLADFEDQSLRFSIPNILTDKYSL